MNESTTFEARLATLFQAYAEGAPVDVDAVTMAASIASERPRRLVDRLPLVRRWLVPVLIGLLLLALATAAAIVGSRLLLPHTILPPIRHYEGVLEAVGRGVTSPDSAVVLSDGEVLASHSDFMEEPNTLDIWDPGTGQLRSAGRGIARRAGAAMIPLPNGDVLTVAGDVMTVANDYSAPIGGGNAPASSPTAELFRPSTGLSSPTGPLVVARFLPTVVLLLDGRVLIAGGSVPPHGLIPIGSAEIYDPVSQRFVATGSMSEPRFTAASARLNDGRVLLVGTATGDMAANQSAEIFDPATGRFETIDGPNHPGFVHGAALADGRVMLVHGGCDEVHTIGPDGYSESAAPVIVEIYDPSLPGFVDGPEIPHCVTNVVAVPDGRAFVTGFYYKGAGSISDQLITWSGIFDTKDGSVQLTQGPRGYLPHAMALSDGRVLIWPSGVGWADTTAQLDPAWADLFH